MDERFVDLDRAVPLQSLLGYLNFSEGKPDPRFQQQLNEAFGYLADHGAAEPWKDLEAALRLRLDQLQTEGAAAFRASGQIEAVLPLIFTDLPAAYRRHHADLLAHQRDADLLQPFFLVRVAEAVLTQGPPWTETDRIIAGALAQLNDFVGYRPVAILENRPRGEPYDHERVRPIPLYLRGAGVALGRSRALVARALEILNDTDPDILDSAGFDPELLDELAVDPRAYDQSHPVNKRPNYVFGEWDPHHLDDEGRYRRFVVRQEVLDGLLAGIARTAAALDRAELLTEAATVLAGTMLMAAGVSGPSPTAYDSSVTLNALIPRIAAYRERFYAARLEKIAGAHGARLREEAIAQHRPFASARQYLNDFVSRSAALQLQQRHLALLIAEMGYPHASHRAAARIPTPSVRLFSDIICDLVIGHSLIERGQLAEAADQLPAVEDRLHRGIACGALADPWNILGFQGLFPLSPAREGSTPDPRINDLVMVLENWFTLANRLISAAAAQGDAALVKRLLPVLDKRAAWWDQYASTTVQDVRRVSGAEAAASGAHLADALGRWHDRGQKHADLAFWRQHLDGFQSAKDFALVIEALLRERDLSAAMGLLVAWVGQADHTALEELNFSFSNYAQRWMFEATNPDGPATQRALVPKFFDHLEANAEDFWEVPQLKSAAGELLHPPREAADDPYGAAYEGMTYRDSTDDRDEGSVLEGRPSEAPFDLKAEAPKLGARLSFLSVLPRLWQLAALRLSDPAKGEAGPVATLNAWLATALKNQERLLVLMDTLHAFPVPEPLGAQEDSMIEYDQRRMLKDQLTSAAIATCSETMLAVGALRGRLGSAAAPAPVGSPATEWEPLARQLEQAIWQGDAAAARAALPEFVQRFHQEPLLFIWLSDGGSPRPILRARLAQAVLRGLMVNLPRLGLWRETYHLLKVARRMELCHAQRSGRITTEFYPLFQAGLQAILEGIVLSSAAWRPGGISDQELAVNVEGVVAPSLSLWAEHSQHMLLSPLEHLRTHGAEWDSLKDFIVRYGRDLFSPRFMTLANLRGILLRGVGPYLDDLGANADPLHPIALVEDLDRGIARADAERHLDLILRILVENFEEFRDYNSSVSLSDYGENLHVLIDLLIMKWGYERQSWIMRPLFLGHEVLVRQRRLGAAEVWRQRFDQVLSLPASLDLEVLSMLEQKHGVRLRSIRDRVEEQLVRPFAVDRLCSYIGPATDLAHPTEAIIAFEQFEKELAELSATPVGAGVEAPAWIRRLEQELGRSRAARSPLALTAEGAMRIPMRLVPWAEWCQQAQEWMTPLFPEEDLPPR